MVSEFLRLLFFNEYLMIRIFYDSQKFFSYCNIVQLQKSFALFSMKGSWPSSTGGRIAHSEQTTTNVKIVTLKRVKGGRNSSKRLLQ